MIRLVKKEDINDLAIIYKELYDNADIGEDWSVEKSRDLLNYWYNKQSDLFFVAEENGKAIGGIVSGVKSWFDGNRLIDGEIFVSKEYQGKHIGRDLIVEHLKQAKIKYNVNTMEFHTYGDETEFPQNWYNRIGFKKDKELVIMNGNVEEVLDKLGFKVKENTNTQNIINYSYSDLSKLLSTLKTGDKAYEFDMLPSYAYLDNENEKEYLESRITAMKNGSKFLLFIVGSKNRIEELKTNDLFSYTLNSCYGDSKIYLIDEEEIKREAPAEFFQLAQGLYLGEREDGSKELFRDLWINSDNLGLLIKDYNIINYVEECISNIINKIDNNEIKCIKVISSN